jgi:hypothetical protein
MSLVHEDEVCGARNSESSSDVAGSAPHGYSDHWDDMFSGLEREEALVAEEVSEQ